MTMADNYNTSPTMRTQKIATVFKDLPTCTCGYTVHRHGCPRYAMRVRFENGKVIVVGPSKHTPGPSLRADGEKLLSSSPPTDSTFAEFSEDRGRSPIPFNPNNHGEGRWKIHNFSSHLNGPTADEDGKLDSTGCLYLPIPVINGFKGTASWILLF
ncbi:hypothetical protein BDV97DRAFT_6581 [Delphinella strobiligena]|nr:hypothetical protein BDV97DRAFT_6581 [Delphinella strobiligena]